MRPLRHWHGSLIAAAWVLWPALLALAFVAFVLVMIWSDLHRPPGTNYLPISIGDIYIRFELKGALGLACLVLGPPAALTALWWGARRRGHQEPPA